MYMTQISSIRQSHQHNQLLLVHIIIGSVFEELAEEHTLDGSVLGSVNNDQRLPEGPSMSYRRNDVVEPSI